MNVTCAPGNFMRHVFEKEFNYFNILLISKKSFSAMMAMSVEEMEFAIAVSVF